jgi:hypothetical protein
LYGVLTKEQNQKVFEADIRMETMMVICGKGVSGETERMDGDRFPDPAGAPCPLTL